MKIMLFNKENKWVEVENGLDFDTFYDEVIRQERPFKFVDCTKEEKARLLEYLSDESAGLDDVEYYQFDVGDNNSVDNIFIFDDLVLYTLENVIRKHETIVNYYKNFQKRMEENDEENGLLVYKYDARIYDEDENEIESWLITVKGADNKEIRKNLLDEIEKKWNENHAGVPLPTEYLSYCRTR
jgi:hypothetical protein